MPDGWRPKTGHRFDLLLFGLRLGVLAGMTVTALGVADHFLAWPFLTAALGPTAYVFVAHPRTRTATMRSAAIGHSAGVASGLAGLAIFAQWQTPSVAAVGHATLGQAGAAGVAIAGTLLLLELFDAHHAPAAATALLVASGIAGPGRPLAGLAIGLAILILIGPLVAAVPGFKREEEP